jgi:hypothetical protein
VCDETFIRSNEEAQKMRTHVMTLISGIVIGLALLAATNGLQRTQESSAAGRAPIASETVSLPAATPEIGDVTMADKMDRMIDECLAMMKSMNAMMGMMGGDMSGMMGGEGMQGMEGMDEMPHAAATPGA